MDNDDLPEWLRPKANWTFSEVVSLIVLVTLLVVAWSHTSEMSSGGSDSSIFSILR